MRRFGMIAAVTGALVAAGAAAAALVGGGGGLLATDPPAALDPAVPAQPRDLGRGERLIFVVGGAFPTREAAERANAELSFGELQGYYVAPAAQFPGLDGVLGGAAGEYVLVSAFRTAAGAAEFAALARAAGAPAIVTPRLENLGFQYVGLGQEAAPDGRGPLTAPIPGLTVP